MNKHYCLFLLAILATVPALAQTVTLSPTVTPTLFTPEDEITVSYDVTGTSLANLSNAYLWVWIPGKNTNAKYNINPATDLAVSARFTKSVDAGRTLFTISFTPSQFFEGSIANEKQLGILLKGTDWNNGQTSDHVIDFWDGSFQVRLLSPSNRYIFVEQNDVLTIRAETPVTADFALYVNDELVNQQSATSTYNYQFAVIQAEGHAAVRLEANANGSSDQANFEIFLPSPEVVRPKGIIPGINYYGDDHTRVTLCLWAPDKTTVLVRGEFTNWQILPEYVMNKDGEYFWIEVTDLTPATEYAFHYLVDDDVFVADPYSDKILDPDDQYIPPSVYPGLKAFPEQARSQHWYFNRLSVFQTNQDKYQWQVTAFQKPAKENLIIYELLIRDFFGSGERTYRNLADTLGYFKRLGVNAIQLMPIMEFNGNESWGYNPAFMFAPDKYYGPKDELKAFIDKCHQEGIAVILDIAMNHQDIPNTYILMDYNFESNRPNLTNKWFNPEATHPFNVFFDMNHESEYTQAYLDTVNHYWLNEFKVDGFRFDLSKGFTQTQNSDVDQWSRYDASRVQLLKRMADRIWEHSPDAIVILEHFAANQEEKELAEYRASEGMGMMLWGNMNHNFSQAAMGWEEESDISGASHQNRSWSVPHLISYMESHDEERLMYKNVQYGNQGGDYSVKDETTSIERIKAASTLFYTVPGPKMLWQFGEFGYGYSINTCEDGSVGDCRVSPKPVGWEYYDDAKRQGLFVHTADLIKLHKQYPVFTYGAASVIGGMSLIKQVSIKNSPYTSTPSNTDQMNVHAIANLTMERQSVSVNLPHTGIWYDYYNDGAPVQVNSIPFTVMLKPGGYKLYTDVPIGAGPVTSLTSDPAKETSIIVYPNPTTGKFSIRTYGTAEYVLSDLRGVVFPLTKSQEEHDISHLPDGMYILIGVQSDGTRHNTKIIKQ